MELIIFNYTLLTIFFSPLPYQVLESVESGAAMTFDYIAFVLLAAWVAAMGLVSNSVATVIASMLLSPLMGPCLAGKHRSLHRIAYFIFSWPWLSVLTILSLSPPSGAFGAVLRKGQLVKLGLMNEAISLMACVLMGFIIGAIVVPAQIPTVQSWPSPEMVNRGNANGLVMGVAVAIPSGMGVALSVLGRNSGGLTGVAISLSLLPPAVNAGKKSHSFSLVGLINTFCLPSTIALTPHCIICTR
jgi:uncharacterized membrane protein